MRLTVSPVCSLSFVLCLSISYCASAQRKEFPDFSRTIPNVEAETVADRALLLGEYGRLPLSFEANQGQTDERVRFLSRANGYTLYLTPMEAVMAVQKFGSGKGSDKGSAIEMKFLGANPEAAISGVDQLRAKSNYFIGNDPKKWHSGIPTYAKVSYKNIYPGIDLVYYGNQRQLEYDFVVAPGADPNVIRLKLAGTGKMRLDTHGDLLIHAGGALLSLTAPKIYQEDGERHQVTGRWLRRSRNELQFALGNYDKTKTIVIDPTAALFYSTYLGGSSTDAATAVAVDFSGDAYITGYTGSTDFPVTQGAFQTQCGGCTGSGTNNAFIAELDPSGNKVYSTYLGGNNGESANGIAIDESGNAYVVGTTFSNNFPTWPPTGTFQPVCAGNCTKGDAFVTELSSDGSSLMFSTFLGGTGADKGFAIAVSPQGVIYVTGSTTSPTGSFPLQNPFQPNCSANCSTDTDAFVTAFYPGGGSLAYSTYLGGSGADRGNGIAVDDLGDAYVVGSTGSSDFPLSSPLQSTCGSCASGMTAAFVTVFDPAGTALNYSTFLSGTKYPAGAVGDSASSVAIDAAGDAFVAGTTTSTNFPTVNAYQSSCAGGCSASDAFVTEFNPTGSALTYSTYLGGSGADQASGIALDSVGNAFVTGQTSSTDFPTPNSNYVFQSGCNGCAGGGYDAFVAEVNVAGSGLVYSSYLGGTTSQSGAGIAVNQTNDDEGSFIDQAVVVGSTTSSNFPVTTGVAQGTFGGVQDAFITQFPDVANCTTTHTQTAFTINATVSCTGNFVPGNQSMNLGFNWGDNTNNGFPGCTAPCQVSSGTASLSFSHTYSPGGPYSASATANDDSGASIITVGFTVTVGISITAPTLPEGVVQAVYPNQTLSATGGTAPYTWSIISGSLPAGLALGATTGVISGTPTTAGTSNFTVQAKDADANTGTLALSIVVVNPLTITAPTLPEGTVQVGYPSQTLSATGGTPPYSWSITVGSLPTGLTLGATTGVISGTPTTAGTSNFTVQAKDAKGMTATKALSIVVVNAPVITTKTLPAGEVNTSYSEALAVTGGMEPYTWSISSGSLPAGLKLSATGGSISGTPTTAGTASFTVQVKDANANTATQALSIVIAGLPTITTKSLPGGTAGSVYSQTLAVTGGGAPYTWSITTGSLPSPLTLAASTGLISGTPTTAGTSNFTVQVQDANANTATQALSIVIVGALSIAPPTLPNGTIGAVYTQTTIGASGGTPPYAWALTTNSLPLPPGINLSTTGAISGTPTVAGIFNFTVQVSDSTGVAASLGLSITVAAPAGAPTCLAPSLQVSSNTNPLAVTATSNCTDSSGTIASTTIDWGDGSTPFSGTSGSYTYKNPGTYSITVTATDTNNLSDSASGTIALTAPVASPVTQGQSAQQSTTVTAPLGVPSVTVTYQCTSVNGPDQVQKLSDYNLSCNINGSGASASVTLTSTPTPVQVIVQTNSTSAELRRPSLRRIEGGGTLYAAFLPLPGIALLGIGGWSSLRRKKVPRCLGLALLGGLMWMCLSCGGGSSSMSPPPPPPANTTPPGSYTVNVTGTSTTSGSTTSTTTSTITVGFTVTIG